MNALPLLLALCGFLNAEQPAGDLVRNVGIARVDITPDFPVRLNGFGGRRDESEGVRQQLWAKALAIDAGADGPAVVIAIDNLGISDDLQQKLAKKLEPAGIHPARLAVTATHTHSAPLLTGVTPTLFGVPIPTEHQANINRYTHELLEKLEQVALAALKDRRPARMEWGIGRVGFASNRRTKNGPVDHDLPLLVVRELDGAVRGLYVNYACHAVTLSDNLINGDWPGYAQERIERNHPGAVALISVGCGADSNPNSGVTRDKAEIAEQQGVEVAAEVDRMLKGGLRPVSGTLRVREEVIGLPFDTLPTRAELTERAKQDDRRGIGHHARVQLARLERGEALRTEIKYRIQTWAFGDSLAMVFLPGEVVVDYALRLKRELDGRRLWINAYANDAPGYIPSERILQEGGYEGGDAMTYYDQPTRLAAGLEKSIVAAVRRQLDDAFRSTVDPGKTQGALPTTPEQSLAMIRTRPELEVELVAAEPLVMSPVAVDFGPDGRVWVAEMYDYPEGVDGDYRPGGRVRVLESSRADGRFDKSSVFLEGIPFPTGVTVWRKGLLICSAPDILYAEDTDGDGRADLVRKLFSGFGDMNYQGRVNSLEYGLDGWVYGSCGMLGGRITSFKGGEALALGNRDFRINPDTGAIEPVTGRTQQGRPRDDWGNWFGNDSGTLCRHYPLPDHYLLRNPYLLPPPSAVFVPAGPDPSRLFPISGGLQLFELSGPSGRPTAACGLGLYRDDLLGPELQGCAFICEPVNLLVHRMRLEPRGTTFAGLRAPDEVESEFLASTDAWFRPVQARTGPDGALWIVDMHRYVIEHPRWIPMADLARIDARTGYDLGRLLRVRSKNRPLRDWPRLDRLDHVELVKALDSDSGWQRDMALQMLLWSRDRRSVTALERLVAENERAQTRLHALCALDGLGAVTVETLHPAISDRHPGVRRHAIRISEQFLADHPVLGSDLLARVSDDDPQVRLQLALTLGQWNDPRAAPALAALASATDPYQNAAVLSSLRSDNVSQVVAESMRRYGRESMTHDFVPKMLQVAAALSEPKSIPALLALIAPTQGEALASWQWTALAGIIEAIERRGESLEALPDSGTRRRLTEKIEEARGVVGDDQAIEATRLAALSLFGRLPSQADAELAVLERLLTPQSPAALQHGAAKVLGRVSDRRAIDVALQNWTGHSPALKGRLLDLFFSRRDGLEPLLAAIASGDVSRNEIDPQHRQQLLEHRDPSLRKEASRLFSGASNSDRAKVLEQYQSALLLTGDRSHGKVVFGKTCSVCHRVDDVGFMIGPDLAALAHKPPQSLLLEILDPSRNLDSRYVVYTAVTKNGRSFSGILASESASSVTLLGQEGKQETLLRVEIDELTGSQRSLMPEGLERDLSPQDMADLLAYLTARAQKAVAGTPEGSKPVVLKPEDGSLRLLAKHASIIGNQITLEPEFGNIGLWHGAGDHVIWDAELPEEAEFDVWYEFACDNNNAGNAWVLRGVEPVLQGKVESTGGWDQYRLKKMGTARIEAGLHKIVLAPSGKQLQGALMDLRALYLVPKGTRPEVRDLRK